MGSISTQGCQVICRHGSRVEDTKVIPSCHSILCAQPSSLCLRSDAPERLQMRLPLVDVSGLECGEIDFLVSLGLASIWYKRKHNPHIQHISAQTSAYISIWHCSHATCEAQPICACPDARNTLWSLAQPPVGLEPVERHVHAKQLGYLFMLTVHLLSPCLQLGQP